MGSDRFHFLYVEPLTNLKEKTPLFKTRNSQGPVIQGWKKYRTMGPLVPEKNLIPRKYYPRKNKIVIIY